MSQINGEPAFELGLGAARALHLAAQDMLAPRRRRAAALAAQS